MATESYGNKYRESLSQWITRVILLLVNLDVFNWSVFRSFWVLWPLLLVVAGVSVLARNRRWVVIAAWGVFLLLLVVYGFFYTQPDFKSSRWGLAPETYSAQMESGIDGAVLRLDLDAGDIDITGGGDQLAVVDTNDRRLSLHSRTSGGTQTVEIDSRGSYGWFPFSRIGGLRSDIALNSDIPWEIDVQTDAANTEIDLAALKVTDLDLKGDACNLKLELSDNVPALRISVRSDVSHITIVVPENVGVRYSIRGDLQHVDRHNVRFVEDGGSMQTEGYADASTQVEIDMEMDVAYVTFTR